MSKKFSISETTKIQREKYVEGALAITSLDAPTPTKEDQVLLKDYIEGKSELDDILKKAVDKYRV